MNMKDLFKITMITFSLATISLITVACSNPRPTGDIQNKTESSFCENYEMKEILPSDSNHQRLEKLRENTYFQGVCS